MNIILVVILILYCTKIILNVNPLLSIILVVGIIGLLVWLFLPEKGLFAMRKNARSLKDRVLIEDTLKFLFDNEYKSLPSPLHSVAGGLNLPVDKVTALIPKLESMGLINSADKNNIRLTDDGRSYALRVIRIHRIWERYLADETSVKERDWHNKADIHEHKMSLQDANELAAKIGNPVVDPHGDPIPTSQGEIPDFTGTPMNELESGDVVRIIHIEDEPRTIYLQLLALELFPGMELRIIENTPEKVVFEFQGEEMVLAPIFAANVTVKKRTTSAYKIDSNLLLSKIKKGEKAKVLSISPACRKQQKRRLMDLGIVPGTEIEVALESASGNPRAYRVLNTLIALRDQHASLIFVEPLNSEYAN